MPQRPQKLLVEFLADFVNDETVRCSVLRHEFDGPKDYGLSPEQVAAVTTFDLATIMQVAQEELEALGIDLAAKAAEVHGGSSPVSPLPGGGGAAPTNATASGVEASLYSGGQIHIRKLEPASIQAQTQTTLTVLGNGFEANPEVQFSKEGESILGTVVATSCDLDLYQRITVEVSLPSSGDWMVQARNSPEEDWNATDVGTLTVLD